MRVTREQRGYAGEHGEGKVYGTGFHLLILRESSRKDRHEDDVVDYEGYPEQRSEAPLKSIRKDYRWRCYSSNSGSN